jgi:hypothetical protein
MNSKNLLETGFSECHPLKTLTYSNLPQDKSVVLVIVDQELSGKPESDILYIGRTKKPLKKMLGGYLAGYGGKNTKKINQMLFDEGYIEKTSISWVITEKPRIMQEELLAKFKEDHGELPIWNTKKKLLVKTKGIPAFKPKEKSSRVSKAKAVAPKTIAKTTPKISPKTKAVSPKKTMAKEEMSLKTAESSKEETAAEMAEKAKNEASSDNSMTT